MMRAIILAAGEGKRLRPLTEKRPKHMIPIAGKPIIHQLIDAFKTNGVTKFSIVVGHFSENIIQYLSNGEKFGIEIEYIHQKKLHGTADALAQTENKINETRFVVCYGDIYVSSDAIREIINAYDDKSFDAAVTVVPTKDQKQYGIVQIDNGYVKEIVEKPKVVIPNSFANAGIYLFERSIFKGIRITKKSRRGELELTDSISNLMKSGSKIKSILIDSKSWIDIGLPWNLLDANKKALQNLQPSMDGEVDDNSTINGTTHTEQASKILPGARVEGPVYIGAGSAIGPNCYIRAYTSIGRNVKIGHGCEIKNSIIMDETKIPHLSYFGDSIIGERCNFGAGTITGNLRLDKKTVRMKIESKFVDSARKKLGTVIGDYVETGINVNFMPGITIGSGSNIGPGVNVSKNIPPNVKLVLKQNIHMTKMMVHSRRKSVTNGRHQ
jgi:bifunctional UDP-N-acetylglucosamine pyrophosphorylase/glucosamine-1-phosphate N-acetyltransferase